MHDSFENMHGSWLLYEIIQLNYFFQLTQRVAELSDTLL